MDKTELIEEITKVIGSETDIVNYSKGDLIIKENTKTPFYIIKKGVCKVFIYDNQGGKVILSELGPGSTLGDMSNITNHLTTANVIADDDVKLYKIDGEDFDRLVQEIPTLSRILYAQLCDRLDHANKSLSGKVNELLELNSKLEIRVEDQVADIKRKKEELETLMNTHNHFMNMAVHDLRSPLTTVMGYLDLLTEGFTGGAISDEQMDKVTGVIHKNCHGMLDLINDILDISKIQNKKLNLKIQPLQIESILEECHENNKIITKNKGMELDKQIENNLPDCLYDPKRLLEVLTNLVSNAIKFSERGTTVTIGAQKGDNVIEVFVRDQGQGIPKDEQDKLFKEFQQISTKSTEGEKGTGLGLAIVKQLVHLHKGDITVDSVEGEGTTFTFTLPIA